MIKTVACEESDSSEKGEADLRGQRNRLKRDGTRLEVEREAGVRFGVHQEHRMLLLELCALLVREAGRELQTPLEALLCKQNTLCSMNDLEYGWIFLCIYSY